MDKIMLTIVEIVIIVAASLVTRYLIPNLIQTLRENKYNLAADIIETAVRAAEQIITGRHRGEEKYELVLSTVTKIFEKYGIKLDETEIEHLIEAAVQVMNQYKWEEADEEVGEGE